MIDIFIKLKEKLYDQLISGNNLKTLSEKIHICIVSILLIQNIPITFYRYFHFPLHLTWVNISEITVYVSSIFLFYRKKRELSTFVTAFGIPIIFIYLLFNLGIDKKIIFINSFWFLLSFMLIYILIIRKKAIRYIYVIFCISTYFIPGILFSFNYPENLIKIIQILSLTLIPYIISTFTEKQDTKIFSLNDNLKLRLQEKEILTNELKSKNEELITFSHIMSHDLKSPLQTIISFSKLIKKKGTLINPEQEKYFFYIEKSAASMAKLIDDLLEYSKIESKKNEFELVRLHTILEEIKSNFQFDLYQKKISLTVSNLPVIYGNKQMLKTLFHNLISNSIKYQPKDKLNHTPNISISHEINDTNYYILIEDNGIGFEAMHQHKLFEPFKRFHSSSEYEGTGLGMSICKKVMDKHYGHIELKSTSEKGSIFKLTFPKHIKMNTELRALDK